MMPREDPKLPSHPDESDTTPDESSSLHAENRELRRLLMDAQLLIGKQNEQIMTLMKQLQASEKSPQRHDSKQQQSEDENVVSVSSNEAASRQAIPPPGFMAARPSPDVDASKLRNEGDDSLQDRVSPKKKIDPCSLSSSSSKNPRRLPREVEMESDSATMHVRALEIKDGLNQEGVYTGTVLVSSGLPHGKGRMVYDQHRSYMGMWRHGHWQGPGHVMSRAYDYKGMFRMNRKHGRGTLKWSDGRVYTGEFVNDMQHGMGTLAFPDGSTFKGEFVNGVREGKGEARFADGGHYVGYFENDVYHGHGRCAWPDGFVYLGEWKNGKTHGHGIELRPDGTIRHEGLFVDNEPVRTKAVTRLEV